MEIKKDLYSRVWNKETLTHDTVGGQSIEMGFTIFENFTTLNIRLYDDNKEVIDTITVYTTPDQVIDCLPTRLASTIGKSSRKNYKHSKELGRFHFFSNNKYGFKADKLWDNSEITKFKKGLDNNQIDLEELIAERKAV